jgi:hypothetical protein
MSTEDTTQEQATTETNEATDEVAMAAGYYAQLAKTIRAYSRNMGGKGLARVISAYAEFPFAEKYPTFRSDTEKQLFTFLLTIQSTKATISKAIQSEQANIEETAVNNMVNEIQEKQKGETHGG